MKASQPKLFLLGGPDSRTRILVAFMERKAYTTAGVNLELGHQVKAALPRRLASTYRPEVLTQGGGFGGLFALNVRQYRRPVLVSSVDGVGTKLKVAIAMDRHDTVGEDLVNHCANDIGVSGAEPLFFLDYISTGELRPQVFDQLIRGFTRGCRRNQCALIGGETAQMPDFYQAGEYDICGTIVGVVERSHLLDGRGILPGDLLVGLASNGLHTNGYSLARKVFFEKMGLKPETALPDLGKPVGEELLKVHTPYVPLIRKLLQTFPSKGRQRDPIKAFAHITGGGFSGNLPRILPKRCDAVLDRGSWKIPPIFSILQREGKISDAEMFDVFNMGIGMVAVVSRREGEAVLHSMRRRKQKAWVIGRVAEGNGKVRWQ